MSALDPEAVLLRVTHRAVYQEGPDVDPDELRHAVDCIDQAGTFYTLVLSGKDIAWMRYVLLGS